MRSITPFVSMMLRLVTLAGAVGACSGTIAHDDQGHPQPPGTTAGANGNTAAPPVSDPTPPALPQPPPVDSTGPGLLDCPTVAYPGTTAATVQLSPAFARACSGCHGGSGEGVGRFPALPGALAMDAFIAKVRQGTQNMPAISHTLIDDATLARDFEALRSRRGDARASVHPSMNWTATEITARRQTGLALWRKPDHEGAACANCHSADAIDLAVIGYPDGTILRRATMHHSLEESLQLVDFIHAQRRAFNITRPCSPGWRVFQPGGEVLPGDTVAQQDEALFAELVRQKLLVATGEVQTVEDADRAWGELAALNMRKLRIGIALPRWTEDRFHGDDHKTINDWMPAVPRLPNNASWYEETDRYLDDPTEARLLSLINGIEASTHDGGFSKRPYASGDLSSVMTSKYHAVQLASHYLRMAALGKPSWYETADSPPPLPSTRGEGTTNPFTGIGLSFQENHCYNNTACPPGQFNALPDLAKAEFDPTVANAPSGSGGTGFNFLMQVALTHPWWTLGAVFDPSFGGGRHLVMHYWLEFGANGVTNFPHVRYHKPFLMAVTMVKRAAALEKANRAPGVPGVLNGSIVQGFEYPMAAIGATADNTRLVQNLVRMVALRQQRALQAGAPVAQPANFLAGTESTRGQVTEWLRNVEDAAKAGKFDAQGLRSTATLLRDVIDRLGKARGVGATAP